MDIFIEPILPRPVFVILGASPVALALLEQAKALGYQVALAAPLDHLSNIPEVDFFFNGFGVDIAQKGERFIVVSTQGRGDEAALKAALALEASYHGFVGSRRKMAALRRKLIADGILAASLETVRAPAGLDLGAITPEEIALSIIAEVTQIRRKGQRSAMIQDP
jgi:xanthine dehydrogenase accessory factor